MKFYRFDDIRTAGSCEEFARAALGARVDGGRCAAVWRGGDNPLSVAIDKDRWYDHVAKEGGGILELCAKAKFGGDIQQAQEFLGDWLRLTPARQTSHVEPTNTKYDKLVADGYAEAARYYYQDLSGRTVHMVVKLAHPKKGKEFLQRTVERWGVKGVDLILYNLTGWAHSPWVVVVEGEKDADTLVSWGLPATTNCGGAEKWLESYNSWFDGKDVVVCRDNDDAGRDHARVVMRNLARHAKSLRLVCPSSTQKGDVTDWRDKEGGTVEKFMKLVKAAQPVPPDLAEGTEEEWAVCAAKKQNKKPFKNTVSVVKTIDGLDKRVEKARPIGDLIEDVHTRFMGFPRKIGDSRLFDHDRDSGLIEPIDSSAALFAWIGAKSKQLCMWGRTSGCVSKEELFEGLIQSAVRYESVSSVPDWPRRHDVYYTHARIPEADKHHAYFKGLVDFFEPANEASRTLIKTFFAAPIYYQRGIPRPCWIVDSEDGPGTGKTTLVEILAELYDGTPIKTCSQELSFDFKELVKRIISSEGRKSRILMVDNVTGTFKNDRFAEMVTSADITGKAPYGRGEECRANNLTYVITANSANCNNDISSRSYTIKLKRPKASASWKKRLFAYLTSNREMIFADMIDILNRHKPFDRQCVSRFPEFEELVLQAFCEDEAEYDTVCADLTDTRSEVNTEEELARQVEEVFRYRLQELPVTPEDNVVFIRSGVIDRWFADLDGGVNMQGVRNLAKIGLLPNIDKSVKRFPLNDHGQNKGLRRSGVMWVGEAVERNTAAMSSVVIIGVDGSGRPAVIRAVISEWVSKKNIFEHPKKALEEAYEHPY